MAPRYTGLTTGRPAGQVLITRNDSAPWIEELGGYLEPRGVGLRQAYDGPGSLRLLEREAFDLAIVSEPLRPFGGLPLLGLIRSLRRGLPCVYVAKTVSEHTLQAALELNVFSVVREPVRLNVVAKLVQRIYEREWNLSMNGPVA